jgi:hypothetical protein
MAVDEGGNRWSRVRRALPTQTQPFSPSVSLAARYDAPAACALLLAAIGRWRAAELAAKLEPLEDRLCARIATAGRREAMVMVLLAAKAAILYYRRGRVRCDINLWRTCRNVKIARQSLKDERCVWLRRL